MHVFCHGVVQQIPLRPLPILLPRRQRLVNCQFRVWVHSQCLFLYYFLCFLLILIICMISIWVERVIFLVMKFGLGKEIWVDRLKQFLLERSLLKLVVNDPSTLLLINISGRARPTLNYLLNQIPSLQAAFRGMVVTYISNALFIPIECTHSLISPGHILSRTFACNKMWYP